MFFIIFMVRPEAKIPGFNERIACHSPFVQQQRNQMGQLLVNAQTRQPMIIPDTTRTLQALQQQGWLHPQLTPAHMLVKVLGYEQCQQLTVLCAQPTPQPTVAREQVAAPYQQPVGNAGAAPDVLPVGAHGGYVEMPHSSLPGNADPVFGPADAYGGAFQNLDVNQGLHTIKESNDLTGVVRQSDTFQAAQERAAAARANGFVPPV